MTDIHDLGLERRIAAPIEDAWRTVIDRFEDCGRRAWCAEQLKTSAAGGVSWRLLR